MQEVRGGDGGGGSPNITMENTKPTHKTKKGNILNYLFDIVYLFQLIVFWDYIIPYIMIYSTRMYKCGYI